MSLPRLYGICLVKNEDDIIAQTLTYALAYCTKIFVVDNGSSDVTWDIVQSLATRHSQIIPFVRTRDEYSEALRALPYNDYHMKLSNHDWWLILDADEFLAEDPQPVIRAAMRYKSDVIRTWQIQFFFTELDHRAWLDGTDNRSIPIFERRRYYLINWKEARLFRNDPLSPWDPKTNKYYPHIYRTFSKRHILNRHYQFRDPEQIQKRLSLRFGNPLFPHVASPDWQSAIVSSKRLNCYREGEPWRFSASGLIYYHHKMLKGFYGAAIKRLRSAVQVGAARN
jgi:glycosyltransferase involved in cell wall biosynthesis